MQRYILPVAKENELGGIKVGEDFAIDKDGTMNLKDNPEALQRQTEQLYQNVAAGKILVAAAITEKKVPTDANATFQMMAENVKKISGGANYEAIFPAFKINNVIPGSFLAIKKEINIKAYKIMEEA